MIKISIENGVNSVVYTYDNLETMDEMVLLFNSILRYLEFCNEVEVRDED